MKHSLKDKTMSLLSAKQFFLEKQYAAYIKNI